MAGPPLAAVAAAAVAPPAGTNVLDDQLIEEQEGAFRSRWEAVKEPFVGFTLTENSHISPGVY